MRREHAAATAAFALLTTNQEENDAMKLSQVAAVAAFGVAGTLAACDVADAPLEQNAAALQQEAKPHSAPASVAISAPEKSSKSTFEKSPGNAHGDASEDNFGAFLPDGATALSSRVGDLNRDRRTDAVIVVDPAHTGKEFLGEGPARIVMLLIRDANGRLRKVKQNDTLVPCENCGGMLGDPFGYVQVNDGVLTVVIEGGSPSARWSEAYEFEYNSGLEDWFLRKVERGVSDGFDGRNKQETLTAKNLGEVRFADFDRSALPNFRLP